MKKFLAVILCASMLGTAVAAQSCGAVETSSVVVETNEVLTDSFVEQVNCENNKIGLFENNPYMQIVLDDIESVQEDYKNAKTNAAKQKVLSEKLECVNAQLNSVKKLIIRSVDEKSLIQKKEALKYEKNFLENLIKNVGRSWQQILKSVVKDGVLPIVGWNIFNDIANYLVVSLGTYGLIKATVAVFLAAVPIKLYGFYRQIVAVIRIIRGFAELIFL